MINASFSSVTVSTEVVLSSESAEVEVPSADAEVSEIACALMVST